MVKDLDSLVIAWEHLKQNGKGYLEIFQGAWASFGERYFPFGVYDEYTIMHNHLLSHFGTDSYFSKHHRIFVELRNLGRERGRLFLYGETTRDIAERLGLHYLVVEGDYDTVQRTFHAFQENPATIREFVRVVFGWQNLPPYKERPGAYGEGRQLDLLAEAKMIHFLDVGKGYSWVKRWRMRRRDWNPEARTIVLRSSG
ncbi:hypothetical protein HYS48_00150 [Candidatus Woesearchaeota archaeon]|nr:hypothetical protein [Candidatus Woesearchaeota archaeon]